MGDLKYTIIKTEEQYNQYCKILEDLIALNDPNKSDEIELLTLLIEKWDEEHSLFTDSDPVELLKSLMEVNNLKAKDLAEIIGLTKGTVSKILNYKKGLSKETIRKLAEYFRVSQAAFNRPYELESKEERFFRHSALTNNKRKQSKKYA